jgi:uncharacterized membrane protein YphA (DoxX/SURF4 family)
MALGIEQRTSLIWVGLLRVINGGLFLLAGIEKVRHHFRGPELGHELDVWASSGKTFPFATEWVQLYVRPDIGNFALAATVGEFVAGGSLVLGFASRLGGLVGLLLNVSYFLASRESINLLMAVVNLAVLVSGGGRAIGIDGPMKERNPRWVLG